MKHLILHLGQLSSEFDPSSFSSYNIENIRNQEVLNFVEELLKGIDEKDLFPYRVSTHLPSEKHESIIIFKEGFKWDQVIRLAVYLRLLPYENWISKSPIIICDDNLPNPFLDKDLESLSDIQNFLNIPGIFYKSFFALFGKGENDEGKSDYGINRFLKTINRDFNTKVITITSENLAHDRHSITNYWGAVKLALNAGYGIDEINYTFPPTIYFNYLLKKYSIKIDASKEKTNFSSLLKKGKVLLIDDNSEKGWKSVLEKIFGENSIDSKSFMIGVVQKDNKGKWKVDSNLNKYDLVFLDLYMPEYQGQKPNLKNGEILLELIKDSYPQVPIIVFTASNKSWTRETVQNFGADGMYVKESPEFTGDQNYSKENFINFEKSIRETLKKYKVLRPYWEAIQKILEGQTFLSIPEKRDSKLKDRIEERLMMFYGLLKRGFEQTKFNERKFHFSDYELAFMTLWSALNEISEAYYDKEDESEFFELNDNNGKIWKLSPPKNHKDSNWKIISSNKYLIKNEYEFFNILKDGNPELINGKYPRLKSKKVESFISKKNNTFLIPSIPENRKEVTREIGMQIAFLILNSNKELTYKEKLCKSLYKLNETRNHLYLTHGNYITTGFYRETEKEKREKHTIKPNGDIKDLFELISFLLTGKENKVEII
jgi:DNA-binding NarL/FixJ family response regulator